MSSAICKVSFKDFSNIKMKVENRKEWFAITQDIEPNDWSVRVIFLEDVREDFTVQAEIDFLMPAADYLLNPGTKFKLRTFTPADAEINVIVKIP